MWTPPDDAAYLLEVAGERTPVPRSRVGEARRAMIGILRGMRDAGFVSNGRRWLLPAGWAVHVHDEDGEVRADPGLSLDQAARIYIGFYRSGLLN